MDEDQVREGMRCIAKCTNKPHLRTFVVSNDEMRYINPSAGAWAAIQNTGKRGTPGESSSLEINLPPPSQRQ